MKKLIALIGALFLSACNENDNVAINQMNITTRPLTAEESWENILHNHDMYYSELKQFYPEVDTFIPFPGNKDMESMYNKEVLTTKEIEKYRNIVINELYDIKTLNRLDNVFQQYVIPELQKRTNEYLLPLLSSWNTQLPKKLEIFYFHDYSSYYNYPINGVASIYFGVNNPSFSADNPFDDKDKIFSLVFHEFIHTLIEIPIIREYGVPQDLKERIVDLICYEFIKRPVQKDFENSFANAYITPDVIRTDLPGAVKKMMKDYKAAQKK